MNKPNKKPNFSNMFATALATFGAIADSHPRKSRRSSSVSKRNIPLWQPAERSSAWGILCLLPFALVFVIACGEPPNPDNPGNPDGSPAADMDAYLSGLPAWEEFSPPQEDFDNATGGPPESTTDTIPEIVNPDTPGEATVDRTYNCTSTPYSLTETPKEIVTFSPNASVLWVGSLLEGKGYLGGLGSLRELPIRERAPLTITIDLLSGNNTRTVDDPTVASVKEAIGSLVSAATAEGLTAGSSIDYKRVEFHSDKQASLHAGFSAKYSGFEVESSLDTSRKAKTSTVMAVYTQKMFTVSMVLPQTPGAVFSDAFTEKLLQEQVDLNRIGPDNLPVYVSSIVYGLTVVFSVTAEATETEIRGVLNAGQQGVASANLDTRQKEVLKSFEVTLATVGGNADNAEAVIYAGGDFSQYFKQSTPLTAASPLSYEVLNLADNTIATVSETTAYSITECTAGNLAPPTGAEYKITPRQVSHLGCDTILGFCCAEVYSYDFWVQNVKVAAWNPPSLQFSYFCDGYVWDLETLGGAPALSETVRLHLDGRDSVRLHGNMQYLLGALVEWDTTWKGTLPIGNDHGLGRRNIANHLYRLAYKVEKVRDLYD